MMRDYDIKFVGKEITPFGGLSLFLKMLERCSFDKQLENCNFPMHIKFRYNGSKAIPIEINPLCFAGFCLNELQTHITGIHPVVAYFENIHISKEEMWKGRENDTYSFLVLERPAQAPANAVFDSAKFKASFSDVLEIREVKEAAVGVAATAFTRTDKAHEVELDTILPLDMMDYMKG